LVARASKVNRKKRRCGAIGGGRGWQPEQVTGEKKGATTSGRGENGECNKARERDERALVMAVAAVRSTAVAVRTTLNSLIMEVIFEEIALSNSKVTVRTPLIRTILKGLVQSAAICPYP